VVEGLTPAEAAHRLDRDGPNALPAVGRVSAWRVLASQFLHFFALMLWVAAGLALLGYWLVRLGHQTFPSG
jgi:magnesium-transporting ATPase (P-type)